MGQPQMGRGAVNEAHPHRQHFVWLEPEELCHPTGGSIDGRVCVAPD
jgi:hypothetical protein